ncbi:hypothetical protein CVT24_012192, partial [Panaeolus cyanescens]
SEGFVRCLKLLKAASGRVRVLRFALAAESASGDWSRVFGRSVGLGGDEEEGDDKATELEGLVGFPELQVLEAGFYRWDGEAEEAVLSRILSSAPKLHTLKLGDRYYGDKNLHTLLHLLPRYPNIVNFSLTGQYLVFLDRDIRFMTHLQSLRLHNCTSAILSNTSTSFGDRFALPNLTTLTISGFDNPTDVSLFFKCVLLPSLKDLTMTPALHRPGFRKMALASRCAITRLTIKDREPVDAYMVQFLASAPFAGLVELTLISDEISTEIVMFLDAQTRGFHTSSGVVRTPVFGATLEKLVLVGCCADDGCLGRLAEGRVRGGVMRYLSVEVGNGMGEHGEDVRVFEALRRDGYDVCLREVNTMAMVGR